MKINKLKYFMILLVFLFVIILPGCSKMSKPVIVTVNSNKLYMKDFLYEIYQTETEGNQLEDLYQKRLGYSYWDYKYNGTTMRELAKNSVLASVVMHEILSVEAKKNHITLTQEELTTNNTKVDTLLTAASEKKLNKIGLNRTVISNAITKIALSDKYKELLTKDLKIDEAAIRKIINRQDYSSKDQYEKAVTNEIQAEKDQQFGVIYNQMKAKYDITINFDYWDKIRIGSITVTK